jgi:hypothetical protein
VAGLYAGARRGPLRVAPRPSSNRQTAPKGFFQASRPLPDRCAPEHRWLTEVTGAPAAGTPGPVPARSRRSSGSRRAQARRGARRVARDARDVERRTWFQRFTQVGLGARAVIYLIVGGLALEVAVRGRSSAQADSSGALHAIARQPSGPFLLSLLAAGFVAYAGWRLVQTVAGKPGHGGGIDWQRLGWGWSAALYLGLCGEAVSLLAGSNSGGSASHPEPLVARVARWPLGPELLGLAAVGLAFGGVALAVWGALHDYERVLDSGRLGRWFEAARSVGIAGDVARGLVVILVAIYIFLAAFEDKPSEAKGMGTALQSFAHHTGGPEAVGVLGVGLLCFGLYSVVEAAFRRSAGR